MSESGAAQKPEQMYAQFSLSNLNQLGLGLGFFGSTEAPAPPPPPCVEVIPLEDLSAAESNAEPIVITEGLSLLKGRVSTFDVFGVANSDLVAGKYEGGLKLWEGSLDLVRALNSEVQEGRLELGGKRVLELGCGHGLPGIFTGLKGADTIHFQDFNAEVLQSLTIPNVNANLKKEVSQAQCLPTIKTEIDTVPAVRFFAGDWSEIHQLLLNGCDDGHGNATDASSLMEECGGYDVILMAETVYAVSSLPSLYKLIKKCLNRPLGVVYVAGKKHYFGVGGGTRQFLPLVEEDGILASHLLSEVADGSSNVREVWKFSLK